MRRRLWESEDGARKTPPLVIPGDDGGGGGWRRWGKRLLVLACLGAAFYAGLKLSGRWRGGSREDSGLPASFPGSALDSFGEASPRGRSGDSAARGGSGSGAAAVASGAVERSLEAALRRYDEQERDFDIGLVGCSQLTDAYGEVDDAFVRLSLRFRQASQEREDSLRSLYGQLTARVDSVNRQFDDSGCPRPE